jgi:hypothetical protein
VDQGFLPSFEGFEDVGLLVGVGGAGKDGWSGLMSAGEIRNAGPLGAFSIWG